MFVDWGGLGWGGRFWPLGWPSVLPRRLQAGGDRAGGLPLSYQVFSGNRSDVTTLEAGLGDEPRKVLEEMGRIGVVDVVLPTSEGNEIRKRCVTRPTEHHAILLHRPGLHLPDSLEAVDR